MKQLLRTGRVVGVCLLGVMLLGCFGGRAYRKQNDMLKRVVSDLRSENDALRSDLATYQILQEKLIAENRELGRRPSAQVMGISGLDSILGELREKGLEFVYRAGYPTVVVSGIFNPGQATISSKGKELLAKIGKAIKSELPACSLRVDGYTDNQPIRKTKEYKSNKALSSARAQCVADFLVAECGFRHDKVHYRGLGEVNPIATNKTAAGRAKNRRAEIVILVK